VSEQPTTAGQLADAEEAIGQVIELCESEKMAGNLLDPGAVLDILQPWAG
jgi:hypothetical protein